MAREADILAEAVAATEMEIFNAAFGKEEAVLDETSDRSLEGMGDGLEGQIEPDEDEAEEEGEESESEEESEEGEGEPEDKAKQPDPKDAKEQQPEGRVPAGRLREQTERAKAAEAERETLKAQLESERTTSRKELDALNAKFDGFVAALQRQQAPQPVAKTAEPEVPPDLFEDPKAYAEYLNRNLEQKLQDRDRIMNEMRIDTSMQVAHSKHGDTFATAYQALVNLDRNNPENVTTGQRILAAKNPGEALVEWHKRNEAFRRIGNDPEKYDESIREKTRDDLRNDPEFRKQLIEELRADAATGDRGSPRTITKLPRSLNGAAGNGRNAPNDRLSLEDSDQAIFDSAFK